MVVQLDGGMDWFTRNIEMQVAVEGVDVRDEGEFFSVPWSAYDGYSALFDIGRPIRGKITLICPPEYSAWIGGVTVTVEETVHFLDIFTSVDICKTEIQVGEPTWLNSSIEYEFSIALNQIADQFKSKWHESYNGETFGLRHTLICSIIRPWYILFNDPVYKSLKLYSIDTPTSNSDVFREYILEIREVTRLCQLILPTQWVRPGHPLYLRLVIEELEKPIDYAQINFFKSECVEEQWTDVVLGAFKVCGPDNIEDAEEPEEEVDGSRSVMVISKRVDDGDPEPRPTDGIRKGTTMEMQIMLDPTLAVSFDTCSLGLQSKYDNTPENNVLHKDAVALRYFLRLIVIDCDGDSFWNTVELFVHRTEKPDFLEEREIGSAVAVSTKRISMSNVV